MGEEKRTSCSMGSLHDHKQAFLGNGGKSKKSPRKKLHSMHPSYSDMRGAVARAAAHANSAASHGARGKALCTRCGFIKRTRLEKVVAFPPPPPPPSGTTTTTTTTAMVSMQHPAGPPLVVKCVYISWCACLGTLARTYTDDISPSNFALQGSFLANSIGSFTLGMLTASDLGEQESLSGLYAGLTVGLCGSYTTFAGWNLRVARGALGDTSGPGGAIVAAVAAVKSLAFFAACFVAGKDLVKTAAAINSRRGVMFRWRRGGGREASLSNTSIGRAVGVMGCVYALLAVLLWVDDDRSRRIQWMACVFAPFGALSRFFLSRHLNNRWRGGGFPAGTFVANVAGSLAMGLIYFGVSAKDFTGWEGIVLKAFQVGFLGALTTMSTFMSEVVGHREKHSAAASYAYLAATAIAAQAAVLIVGAVLG